MKGDAKAFVLAQGGLVRAFFLRRCADPDDAEDLAQEALCAILDAWPAFRGDSAPTTWAWAICSHVFSRHLQTKRRRERALAALAAEALAGEEPGSAAGRPALSEEDRLGLAFVLDGLGEAERALYECHYVRGLPVKDIALLLGRPEGTIKYQLFLLRKRVADLFSR